MAVASVSACGSSDDSAAGGGTTATAAPGAAAPSAPAPSEDGPAGAAPTTGGTGQQGGSGTTTTVQDAVFQTPSKNIYCQITDGGVGCQTVKNTWKNLPPRPSDCGEGDYGKVVVLDKGAKPRFGCTGDTLVGQADRTLAYGSTLRAGTLSCTSESAALTCRDRSSGRSFAISTGTYRFS